jgi:hypothetical protein
MGMPVEECKYMDIEPEFTKEQEEEYYNVESVINQIIKEKFA